MTLAGVMVAGVMVAGACGAVLRYALDRAVQRRFGSDFPIGILLVNTAGSFVLGLLTGSALHHGVTSGELTVAGSGLIGAFTTFSTFSYDTVRLAENDQRGVAALNLVASVALGLGAAAAGLALGSYT